MPFISAGRHLRGREACHGGELVHQRADCLHGAGNGFGASVNHGEGSVVGRAALQVTLDALRRKRDRRERILDFMRHAPRDFAPCNLLLRLQQIGQVFEDDDVSESLRVVLQDATVTARLNSGRRW